MLILTSNAALLPATTIAATWQTEPWIAMWAIAFSIFFACKILTLGRLQPGRGRWHSLLAYVFLWPGMDPKPFVFQQAAPGSRPRTESGPFRCVTAALHLTGGVVLIWGAVPAVGAHSPFAAAWLGMTGIVLLLHFGVFHLLALVWQARGVRVRPLMRTPLQANSLSDFWGGRWNRAFSDLAREWVYRSLWRRLGPARCTLLVFLISGLVHDLVISLPARGGWGLPTLYFLIQGWGILIERSATGRRAGLGRGMCGRLFTLSVLVLPLPGLFHPPFIQNVVMPFLELIQIS